MFTAIASFILSIGMAMTSIIQTLTLSGIKQIQCCSNAEHDVDDKAIEIVDDYSRPSLNCHKGLNFN